METEKFLTKEVFKVNNCKLLGSNDVPMSEFCKEQKTSKLIQKENILNNKKY